MKKLFITLLLAGATLPVLAQHNHGHRGHWARSHHGGWHWMVPAIIGGAVVYNSTRHDPVIIQQPVIIQPPVQVPYAYNNCTPWTETQHSDGTITRTRTCTQ